MWEYIENCLKQHPDSVIGNITQKYTYGEVLKQAEDLSQKLTENFRKGGKCAVLCMDGYQAALSVLSCWRAGLVPVPMSMNYGIHACKSIMTAVDPDLMLTDDAGMATDLESLIPVLDIKNEAWSGKEKTSHVCSGDVPDDVALIMCTSGTTGKPKAAMIAKKGLRCNVEGIVSYFPINDGDRILISRPIYHCAVMTGEFLSALRSGASIIFSSNKYEPRLVARDCEEQRITILCGTPTLFYHLALVTRRKPLTEIRIAAVSGECMRRETAATIRRAFPGTAMFNVYGLTEASPRVSFLPAYLFDTLPDSVGIPLPETCIEIRDMENYDVRITEPGTDGLVFVKSPSVMKGYYRNSAATEMVLRDGWLNTGDIGHFSADGLLFIKSRYDDMIIKAGMNIYPVEVEAAMMKSGIAEEILVHGEKGNITEEIIADVVLRSEYRHLCEKEIPGILCEHVPEYMHPSRVNIVESLRRNASGKLIRRENKKENR